MQPSEPPCKKSESAIGTSVRKRRRRTPPVLQVADGLADELVDVEEREEEEEEEEEELEVEVVVVEGTVLDEVVPPGPQ